jgi:hypothetical protein
VGLPLWPVGTICTLKKIYLNVLLLKWTVKNKIIIQHPKCQTWKNTMEIELTIL